MSAATPSEQALTVVRAAQVPDPLRLARYVAAPTYGPRILFFSGGTALNPLSEQLVSYTHNSIHIITPFDSGGSSGKLREPFDILGIGDLRSRLMALADRSVRGNAEVFEVFRHRLPVTETPVSLHRRLQRMSAGQDALIERLLPPMREIICSHLRYFLRRMPDGFDLRGASIGNLVLVGGYWNNHQNIDSVVFLFSKLVGALGTVRPVVTGNYHLAATLEDGSRLLGQHFLAGKEVNPISSPVASLDLVRDVIHGEGIQVDAPSDVLHLIRSADLICFPMGSFFSSVMANLLPRGVGAAVRDARCPKIYVPNTGCDPEQYGMSIGSCVQRLLEVMRRDVGESAPVSSLVNFVIMDVESNPYRIPLDRTAIQELGVGLIERRITYADDAQRIDPALLLPILLSLA